MILIFPIQCDHSPKHVIKFQKKELVILSHSPNFIQQALKLSISFLKVINYIFVFNYYFLSPFQQKKTVTLVTGSEAMKEKQKQAKLLKEGRKSTVSISVT